MTTKVVKTQVGIFDHHIDNGGPTVIVNKLAETNGKFHYEQGQIVIGADYFGYPSVSATLQGAEINAEFLRELGEMLIQAAADFDKK